jgi:hypothetical protein
LSIKIVQKQVRRYEIQSSYGFHCWNLQNFTNLIVCYRTSFTSTVDRIVQRFVRIFFISQECVEICICLIVCSKNNNNISNNNRWVTAILKYLFFCINHILVPSCTATPGGNLLSKTSGALPWTLFAYNYTPISTIPTLVFAFAVGSSDYNYLDDVSVVDNSAPSIQLLQNPNFQNSTTTPTGWTQWCATVANCGTGFPGTIISNSSCYTNNCYIDHCHTNYDYLVQSFSATIGHTYTISFWLQQVGATTLKFYANVEGWRILFQLQRRKRQI